MARALVRELQTAALGYPRIGLKRELKKATEAFWKGQLSQDELLRVGREIRKANWQTQRAAGIDVIPSNDFSFYDQVLDTTALLGAVPTRYGWRGGQVDLDTYFSMARGIQEKQGVKGKTISAMEMTKWFDTNYHYIVPEFHRGQSFRLSSSKIFDEFKEAKAFGIETRPVLLGPVSFLLLGKAKDEGFSTLELLDAVLPVYEEVLKQLRQLGATAIQLDEPTLVTDLDAAAKSVFRRAYERLARAVPELKIVLATYFGALGDNVELACSLPVDGLHVDLVRGAEQLAAVERALLAERLLSLGVVDGRNIWRADLTARLTVLKEALGRGARQRYQLAPSCSLLHTPLDLEQETKLDAELKSWLAFAKQKLAELSLLKRALADGEAGIAQELEENRKALAARASSRRTHNPSVKTRLAGVRPVDAQRRSSFKARQAVQREQLRLPEFPTTTIGSFPQTADVRQTRAKWKSGELSLADYEAFLKEKTQDVIRRQESLGLDVLVHGEFERNDMVEYFGEQLEGFAFTEHGWVQSYGSRYVKPPVIFGDVSRPRPMTVAWSTYAQSLTKQPVKGMLTGPITILQWSFVRDDQPRSATAQQIALAIRDEVVDLERAGIRIIQIDEPAIREGLPLRRSEWPAYLRWAVEAFRLSSSGVKDETQIHTHMCYSEFNDIIESIAAMDADVISIETSRSQMELLDAFVKFRYPNEIGPGVYDIHSPRVPLGEEIEALLKRASALLPSGHVWVNPDCGLKTRGWEETELSLRALVRAARRMRERVAVK